MRIISGKHKGRRFEIPKRCGHIRPTADRVREAVFNLLAHGGFAPALEEARVLDLCCGTGAMGFEALSRGAVDVTFVDKTGDSLALVQQIAEKLGELPRIRTLSADATELPPCSAAFDLCFLDPPYQKFLIPKALKSLDAQGWLKPGAIVIAEHDQGERLKIPEGYETLDTRSYGRAAIAVLRHA